MLSILAKFLLTSTAITPVLLIYAVLAYQIGDIQAVLWLSGGSAVLLIICLSLLSHAQRHLERVKFSMDSVEAADRENMSLFLFYLSPLFTAQFESINWVVWILVMLLCSFILATGYSYHFNPLLGVMGWRFYKVGTKEGVTYVLITKKQLRNTKDTIEVGQLTEYIVMDMERK